MVEDCVSLGAVRQHDEDVGRPAVADSVDYPPALHAVDRNLAFTITGGNENGSITITDSGTVQFTNNANINGLVTIDGTQTTVDNFGTFNSGLLLTGDGTSLVTNNAGATINNGFTSTGASADVFRMLGGTVNGEVKLGPGNDSGEVSDGTITGFFRTEAGFDQFLWTGGFIGGLDREPRTMWQPSAASRRRT